ncbi:MAG: hypothetical protein F4234_01570 [Gammaproteobacteria bacterium]|nr:hypothetical protein [Gammaproteobacteria bacterium]MXX05807.1 hypothetical protein [Gammaproteobacteria bacterium]MXY90798.1 hypothetical protein [Gammaproteobacteria bacterium]MYC60747.1 hypothetical protein [Gammaproteobacteria bacterium]MYE29793.1 hypothetical protein [Gammaproteobacteria bacterium]
MENAVWRLFDCLLHGNFWKFPQKNGIVGYIDNHILAVEFSFAFCPKLFGIRMLGLLDDFRSGQYFDGHFPVPSDSDLQFYVAVSLFVGDAP